MKDISDGDGEFSGAPGPENSVCWSFQMWRKPQMTGSKSVPVFKEMCVNK